MKLCRILLISALICLTSSGCSIREIITNSDVTTTKLPDFIDSYIEPESDEMIDSVAVVYEDTEPPQTEMPQIEVPQTEVPQTEETVSAETEPETQPVTEKVEKIPEETHPPETTAIILEETTKPEPVLVPPSPPETEKEPEITEEITASPPEVYAVIVSSSRRCYKIGESASLTVDIYPDNAENKSYTFIITSGNADISDNKVSLYESGNVTVRATCENGVYGEIVLEAIDIVKYADEILRYTNIERQNNGLSELSGSDTALCSVASTRVKELMQSYSHQRPNGSDCYELYKEKGISFTMAAENIAKGYSNPEDIVKAWMSSPGHMKNILNPDFVKVGIAVEMDSDGILYWTQNFSN